MRGIIDATVRLVRAGRRAYARKWSFLGFFAVAFLGSVVVLGQLGLLPETPSTPTVTLAAKPSDTVGASAQASTVPELPTKIEIPKIALSVTIANPTTTAVTVLDGALLRGAVHYPTSALLGETGNVVLFGHSSYLPLVNNQAYKTFNGIQKLAAGDVVTVFSATVAHTYRVRNVSKENADTNAAIALSAAGRILTLVTCNSFGTKEDRFVVTADFVESHSISS
jgi:LPXTG-site transpeptidase (sortase) family protein